MSDNEIPKIFSNGSLSSLHREEIGKRRYAIINVFWVFGTWIVVDGGFGKISEISCVWHQKTHVSVIRSFRIAREWSVIMRQAKRLLITHFCLFLLVFVVKKTSIHDAVTLCVIKEAIFPIFQSVCFWFFFRPLKENSLHCSESEWESFCVRNLSDNSVKKWLI